MKSRKLTMFLFVIMIAIGLFLLLFAPSCTTKVYLIPTPQPEQAAPKQNLAIRCIYCGGVNECNCVVPQIGNWQNYAPRLDTIKKDRFKIRNK